jgi:small subunit ribosomal protein S9
MSTTVNTRKIKASEVLTKDSRVYATGRRKTASARVWVAKGSGKVIINGKHMEEYLARPVLRMIVNQPFAATDSVGIYDVWCTVKGSGLSGQAGAIRLGISRALDKADGELHTNLRQGGFLTRDSREVERKKYGHKKARKRFQFSKR